MKKKIFDYLEDNEKQLKNIDFFNQKELIELISIFKDRSSSLNEITSNVLQMTSVKNNFTNEKNLFLKILKNISHQFATSFQVLLNGMSLIYEIK